MPNELVFSQLAVGCCPPGGPSNALTLLMGGDLKSSIVITGLGTILTIGKSLRVGVLVFRLLSQELCVRLF